MLSAKTHPTSSLAAPFRDLAPAQQHIQINEIATSISSTTAAQSEYLTKRPDTLRQTSQCPTLSSPPPTRPSSSPTTGSILLYAEPPKSANVRKALYLIVVQADKLQTLIKAANVQDVEPIWTTLFAKVRCLDT